MPVNIPPILILAILWLVIGLLFPKLKQANSTKNTAEKKAAARPAPKPGQTASGPDKTVPTAVSEGPSDHPTVLQPSVSFSGHDDSVYQGSLNAFTGEGYDPCHDEQLAPLTALETARPAAESAAPGLRLEWTGDDLVRGIVLQEILKRR